MALMQNGAAFSAASSVIGLQPRHGDGGVRNQAESSHLSHATAAEVVPKQEKSIMEGLAGAASPMYKLEADPGQRQRMRHNQHDTPNNHETNKSSKEPTKSMAILSLITLFGGVAGAQAINSGN